MTRFAVFALIAAFVIVYGVVQAPGYTDVYYHFNAAQRLATGQGLTDPYVWTYIGATDDLPMPSHLYWMPLTSILASFGLRLFNAPESYAASQVLFAPLLALAAVVGFYLGRKLGGTPRHAWIAGLIALFSGVYVRFWGTVDTFAPYAAVGSLCLLFMGHMLQVTTPRRAFVYAFIGGVFGGLAHMTRADGVLLVIVGVVVALWTLRRNLPRAVGLSAVLVLGYLLTMTPWFIRNVNAIGTPLPLGGTQAAWFTEYNELFNYPPDANPSRLFADGVNTFLSSRWEAFVNNLGTFVAVEGLVVMTIPMLVGVWVLRNDPRVRVFWVYALGLHFAFTLVFPLPGYRGGLLHSAAALVPFWAALGVVGLDRVIAVVGRWRRWRIPMAQRVFSAGLLLLAVLLGGYFAYVGRTPAHTDVPAIYAALIDRLPAESRVLYDDPPELYYFAGMGGATLPNETPDALLAIAREYEIDYLLLKNDPAAIPPGLADIPQNPPDFLTPIEFEHGYLYAIQR